MKMAVDRLIRASASAVNQRRLRELAFFYADIHSAPGRAVAWDSLTLDRTNSRWRELVELARLLLGDRFQTTSSGPQSGFSLTFDMSRLFEAYVTRTLKRALAGSEVTVHPQGGRLYCLEDTETGAGRFMTKPDILVKRKARVELIIDTEWKRVSRLVDDPKRGVSQADAYQMMAYYSQLYACADLLLLYRASEVAMLSVWHLLRPLIGKSSRDAKDLTYSIRQMIDLHLTIASELLERTVFPHTGVLHGVSMAVGSREASDVNLALFDILGRIGMAALWIKWVGDVEGATDLAGQGIAKFVGHGLALIETNPALLPPATDRQATDVALFLFAWSQSGAPGTQAQDWLRQMATRFDFTIRTRGRYPIVSVDYRDIVAHTHDRSDAYFEETTSGSSLLPLIASWLHAFGDDEAVEALAKLQRDKLDHSTWQLWLPDEDTEQGLYSGEDPGGRSLNDLSLQEGGGQLLEIIAAACKEGEGLRVLTACATGYWPIVLVACRHHHLPVPPGFWIDVLIPEVAPA